MPSRRGHRATRPVFAVVAVLAVSLVATSCGQFSARGLQMRQDDSITFDAPAEGATVTPPFELTWTDSDRPAGTRYAVVINRAPMPPGEDLSWFMEDGACTGATGVCPTDQQLVLRGVIVTDEPRADVTVVPGVIGGRDTGEDEFVVIRIDAQGRRISEAAFLHTLDVQKGQGL